MQSVPYSLYANQVKNYPETGTDGYYLKWDASANNGNGSWLATPVSGGSSLPTSYSWSILTWNGNAWIAQDNDGNEPDDQMSTEVMLDPPQDYDNDQVNEAVQSVAQGQLGHPIQFW